MLIEPFIFAVAAAVAVSVAYCASVFFARSRRFLDHPNDRSSHARATPRSGGVAIVAGWFAGLFVLAVFTGRIDFSIAAAELSLLALTALLLGLADDKLGLAPVWKFCGQVVIATSFAMIFAPLGVAPLPVFGDVALPAFAGILITVLWIVGFMNAFNFMDGANGLAGGAGAVGLAWVAVIASFAGAPILAVFALLLALATVGFLPQNMKRGKLFMGDNGSMALGFLIAAFAILGANWTGGRFSALVVPVIFMPFLFDVFWTLVSRAIRGRNVIEAHREHIYQLLMREGVSHARVAVLYMALTALSAGAAIMMLTLPPALQWLAPLLLALAMTFAALPIYRRAREAGLLAHSARNEKTDENFQVAE